MRTLSVLEAVESLLIMCSIRLSLIIYAYEPGTHVRFNEPKYYTKRVLTKLINVQLSAPNRCYQLRDFH